MGSKKKFLLLSFRLTVEDRIQIQLKRRQKRKEPGKAKDTPIMAQGVVHPLQQQIPHLRPVP